MVCAWQSFFTRWWQEQTEDTKDLVRKLVDQGQLDFVNGGYVQHDEAAAHYVAMIDQTTLGHRCPDPHTPCCWVCCVRLLHTFPNTSLLWQLSCLGQLLFPAPSNL